MLDKVTRLSGQGIRVYQFYDYQIKGYMTVLYDIPCLDTLLPNAVESVTAFYSQCYK